MENPLSQHFVSKLDLIMSNVSKFLKLFQSVLVYLYFGVKTGSCLLLTGSESRNMSPIPGSIFEIILITRGSGNNVIKSIYFFEVK